MNRRLVVDVLYNETPSTEDHTGADLHDMPLNFEPYFDLEISDTREDISQVVEALRSEGFDALSYNIQGHFEDFINILKKKRPDVVFNMVESFYDSPLQEVMAAGLCETLAIPYTGSPPLTLGICQRKGLSKQILLANGIRTPRFKLISVKHIPSRHGLYYPLIVKPGREDGSIGVENESVVSNLQELKERVEYILEEFHQPAIVEEFIDGRELNISILGSEELSVLPISEIDFTDLPKQYNNIVTYQAKWEPRHEAYHRTIPICPASLSRRVEKRIKEIALKAYQIMGCRDYARVDMRIDRKNNPFVLEVNPNPHIEEGVGLMRSAEAHGLSFSQTLRRIVEFALKRSSII